MKWILKKNQVFDASKKNKEFIQNNLQFKRKILRNFL